MKMMRVAATPEMKQLRAVFSPYLDRVTNRLRSDAPAEAKLADEKYQKLFFDLQKRAEHDAGWDDFFK